MTSEELRAATRAAWHSQHRHDGAGWCTCTPDYHERGLVDPGCRLDPIEEFVSVLHLIGEGP